MNQLIGWHSKAHSQDWMYHVTFKKDFLQWVEAMKFYSYRGFFTLLWYIITIAFVIRQLQTVKVSKWRLKTLYWELQCKVFNLLWLLWDTVWWWRQRMLFHQTTRNGVGGCFKYISISMRRKLNLYCITAISVMKGKKQKQGLQERN